MWVARQGLAAGVKPEDLQAVLQSLAHCLFSPHSSHVTRAAADTCLKVAPDSYVTSLSYCYFSHPLPLGTGQCAFSTLKIFSGVPSSSTCSLLLFV